MKRFICVAVLMAAVLGLGIAEIVHGTRLFGDMSERLVDLEESIRLNEGAIDNPDTKEKLDGVLEKWEKSRNYVLLSSNHAIARSLDEKLVSLKSWIECNGYEDARMLCLVSLALTRDLIDETYPIPANLF